jgi:hypothetical protein
LVDLISTASAAASFVSAEGTIYSAIRQLVRPDDAFGLYKQVLDTVRTCSNIDSLLAQGFRRPTFTPPESFAAAADAEGNSAVMDEKAAAQTGVGAWTAWERRYNPELVLLVSVLILFATVILIVLTWQAQTAPAPSQLDPVVTSPRHRSVSGGSQQASRKEPQSESCSPTSGPANGPVQLLPVDDKGLGSGR